MRSIKEVKNESKTLDSLLGIYPIVLILFIVGLVVFCVKNPDKTIVTECKSIKATTNWQGMIEYTPTDCQIVEVIDHTK